MTDHDDDDAPGPHEGSGEGAGRKLDEDAAWRAIVENYGDRPELPDAGPDAAGAGPDEPEQDPSPADPPSSGILDAGWRERDLNSAPDSWEDEGHFVPPPAPPVPIASPRRRLAWSGLAGAPLIMLIAVVLGISLPGWLLVVLAAGFVGGFVYLIATMPDRHDRGWPGDDGAVV